MQSKRNPARYRRDPTHPTVQGITLSESTLRIAPRSAVAMADVDLLRVARTDPVPARGDRASLVDRLRRRLAPGARRA